MKLARQQAERCCHEAICTEHMLLALVDEGMGVAAHVLESLGVELRRIQFEVERTVQPGAQIFTGELSLSPAAANTIQFAWDESHNTQLNYVGTEHLLLGMLREEGCIAGLVLINLGLNLDVVRGQLFKLQRLHLVLGDSSSENK